MLIIILVLGFSTVSYIQIKKLIREKMWGEIAVFSFLMSLGFIYTVLQIFNMAEFINPSNILRTYFKPVAEFFFNNILGSPFK